MSEIADRIFELIDPWDRPYTDDDETKAEIDRTIAEDPKAIINDLLDRLEELI